MQFSLISTSKAFHTCNEFGIVWLVWAVFPPGAVVWRLMVRARRGPAGCQGGFNEEEHRGAGTLVFSPRSDELRSRMGLSIPQPLGFV